MFDGFFAAYSVTYTDCRQAADDAVSHLATQVDIQNNGIRFDLDHRDGYSVVVFLPYHLDGSKNVVYEQTVAQKGAHDVFEDSESENA